MSDDVIITDKLKIPASEIEWTAVRARGSGGQNVNKVATAVHLRFDIAKSPSLPDGVRSRLLALGDQRITDDGILVIKAQSHRSQDRNRRAAIERLRELVLAASTEPVPRKKTRPGKAAVERRLSEKRRRAKTKQDRGPVRDGG